MKKRYLRNMLAVMLLAIVATPASSQDLNYNFLEATPIGSWQLREDTNTDHKGRQTVFAIPLQLATGGRAANQTSTASPKETD